MNKKEKIIFSAGFIDADGCITTAPSLNFRISVSSTYKNILLWLNENFKGNINNQHLPKNKNHNMAWKWVLCKDFDVLEFLKDIEPYMIVKKTQAQEVIKYLKQKPILNLKDQKKMYLDTKLNIQKMKKDKHIRGGYNF